jgi:pseudouridine-5'-phosphate glycosidase/pseudouridine kinase
MLFANPIPEQFAMQKAEIDAAIDQAVLEAAEQGFHGHANTPFILSKIKELTHGNSLPANRALIESNVAMAAKVAVELSKFPASESLFSESQQQYLETLQNGVEIDRRKLNKMLATMDAFKASGSPESRKRDSIVENLIVQKQRDKDALEVSRKSIVRLITPRQLIESGFSRNLFSTRLPKLERSIF